MSFVEVGVYVMMMCQQWRAPEHTLPDEPGAVAELIAITVDQAMEVAAAWPAVRRKFVAADHKPGRIWNVGIEKTRRAQRLNFRKRSDSGRIAGKASAAKRLSANVLDANDSLTAVERSSTDQYSKYSKYSKKRIIQKSREERTCGETSSPPSATPETQELFEARALPFLQFPVVGLGASDWPLSEAQVAEWAGLFPGLDVRGEARKALAWVLANPDRRKTVRGMAKFLVGWLSRAVDRGGALMPVSGAQPVQNKRVAGLIAGGQAFLNRRQG